MRLTEFGMVVRRLRLEYGLSLKEMAKAMNMGSSYLSALEYGERKLNEDHVERAVQYLAPLVKSDDIKDVRAAAARTTDTVDTTEVPLDLRHTVAAFVRRLRQGHRPSREVMDFLETSV